MIWFEKDYVYGDWIIKFGKRGPKYLPDGTKWSSRGGIGFSLNPLIYLAWLHLFIYWTRWVWVASFIFILGYILGANNG